MKLDLYLIINPVAVFLTMFRYGLDGAEIPIPMHIIAIAFGTSILFFVVGISIFKRYEGMVIRYV